MAKNVHVLKPKPDLLLLHIELSWIKPAIWRRVVVPENITLGKLHTVIQFAMGWEAGHLHEFEIAGEKYGIPDPDGWGPPINSETRKTLIKALSGQTTFSYLYDFGDGWDHRVKVEKKLPAGVCPHVPYCIEGASACPPEDIGGAPGYANFLEVMADPRHPEFEDMVEWYGGTFDPALFELELVNQWLKEFKV